MASDSFRAVYEGPGLKLRLWPSHRGLNAQPGYLDVSHVFEYGSLEEVTWQY